LRTNSRSLRKIRLRCRHRGDLAEEMKMERPVLLVLALLLASGGSALATMASPADPRVYILSPVEGQQFAPGDRVSIVAEIAPSLQATDGMVTLAGLGSLKPTGFSGTGFDASFVIPEF